MKIDSQPVRLNRNFESEVDSNNILIIIRKTLFSNCVNVEKRNVLYIIYI